MIKNVIFDMGNVLLDCSVERALDRFCKSEQSKDIMRRELFDSEDWQQADAGFIKNQELYDIVSKRVPSEYHAELDALVKHWHDVFFPVEGAKAFCEFARSKGCGIYVLSNASEMFYVYFPTFSELEFFDGVVVSSDIKVNKPDRRIYDYILNKYSLVPEDCLFIDDRQPNIDAAMALGINGELFKNNYDEIREKYFK